MFILFGIILVVTGLILGIISIAIWSSTKNKRKNCVVSVDAIVKEIRREEHSLHSNRGPSTAMTSYYPIYEYTIGGRTVTEKSEYGLAEPKIKVGQTVSLLVNPNDTDEFYCESDPAKPICIIFGCVGTLLLCVGIVLLVLSAVV